jgi:hypothetical protein
MMKKAFAAMALAGMAMSAQASVVINEGFTDVAGLASKGWVFNNGANASGWTQGATAIELFNAQSGAANSYASASFVIAAETGGAIDSWLLTSAFDASKGATVSFYLRADDEPGFTDQVNFGFVNANGSLTGLGLTSVNPVPDTGWIKYTAWVGADTLTTARFGFEYVGSYDTSNYVGLDTLVVDVPEPASMMLIAGGLLGLGAARRRSRA